MNKEEAKRILNLHELMGLAISPQLLLLKIHSNYWEDSHDLIFRIAEFWTKYMTKAAYKTSSRNGQFIFNGRKKAFLSYSQRQLLCKMNRNEERELRKLAMDIEHKSDYLQCDNNLHELFSNVPIGIANELFLFSPKNIEFEAFPEPDPKGLKEFCMPTNITEDE